jgi:hypothetical protein
MLKPHRAQLAAAMQLDSTQHKCIWMWIASGGILSMSKEPPRAPFDWLRALAPARNLA